MRIIASSKILYNILKNLSVNSIAVEKGIVTLSGDEEIVLPCAIEGEGCQFKRVVTDSSRWERVFETVRLIPEQPIVLEITKTNIRLSIDC